MIYLVQEALLPASLFSNNRFHVEPVFFCDCSGTTRGGQPLDSKDLFDARWVG